MKFNYNLMIAAACIVLCTATACDARLEEFECVGSTAAPTAISASAVTSEALPGQIKLTWTNPEEDFAYMQIRYNDPLQKKDVCKLVSKGTNELLIDNTRARFGDYSFSFQTFNAKHEGSEVTEVTAHSGKAPATVTEKRTKVSLVRGQLSCNYPDSSEGYFDALIDGDLNNFFHTNWHSPQVALPHYIQIDFNEAHGTFAFEYYTRNTSNTDGFPTVAELQISTDGENWETVSTLTDLPAKKSTKYSSAYVKPDKAFTHFRFNVTHSSQDKKYFHVAEIAFYDVDVQIYDPETAELD